jgi:hypothetical protein
VAKYQKLRDLVSHRVTFEYDTGARIVGYLAMCKPPTGPVQLAVMSDVDILDQHGRVLEHHAEFSFVPNLLSTYRLTEGPSAAPSSERADTKAERGAS